MRVSIVSLGCAKNLVDSETIAYLFKNNKIEIVNDLNSTDIIFVNTCGFIESSKRESINVILEMASYNKILIVAGCLVERYKEDLMKEMPEVDLFVSIKDYPKFPSLLENVLNKKINGVIDNNKRILSTPPFTAYLKISDGCNNCCTYCAIPLIRGAFKSYPLQDLINQAKDLAKKGIKELVVISQDTTRYGEDLDNVNIVTLLKNLLKIEEFHYIRLLYLYPDEISDELIELIGANERLTPYFDIPIQHASSKILSSMNRRGDKKFLSNLFKKIRDKVPNSVIRTTIIVGFPGETDEDFNELIDLVKEVRFDHLGTFTFSPEEGTKAYLMEDQIDENVKLHRYGHLMEIQQQISYENNQKRIGMISKGIIVDYDEDRGCYLVRSSFNAPDEIDGNIYCYIDSYEQLVPGQLVEFEVVDALEYDLIAKIINN